MEIKGKDHEKEARSTGNQDGESIVCPGGNKQGWNYLEAYLTHCERKKRKQLSVPTLKNSSDETTIIKKNVLKNYEVTALTTKKESTSAITHETPGNTSAIERRPS